MQILGRGDGWVAFHKPAGFHVHPPEDTAFRIPREKIALYAARAAVGAWVYPVHRLDAATCGVLLMALDSASASHLARQFQERQVHKVYHAVVRGWTADSGEIDTPLALDSTGALAESHTSYWKLASIEVAAPVGKRFPTARYSLVEAHPRTGRFHQIRRHLNRISHPVIGDAAHGDSHHNRFFRERMGFAGLCLKAHLLEFTDLGGKPQRLEAPDDEKWVGLRRLFSEDVGGKPPPL